MQPAAELFPSKQRMVSSQRREAFFTHRLTSLIGPAKGEWRMAGANEHDYLHL